MKAKNRILSFLFTLYLVVMFGCATQPVKVDPVNLEDRIEIKKSDQHVIANLYFALYDPEGKLKDYREYKNIVVNAGKAGVASRINGADGEAAFTYVGIGIGTTAATATDTALESPITTGGGARAAATPSRVTVNVTNDTAQLQLTYSFTLSFAITESGVFNAGSGGTMLARRVFSAINVANGDSLQVTWKFTTS